MPWLVTKEDIVEEYLLIVNQDLFRNVLTKFRRLYCLNVAQKMIIIEI